MKAFHVRAVGCVNEVMQMGMIILRGDCCNCGHGLQCRTCTAGRASITLWHTAEYGIFEHAAHS